MLVRLVTTGVLALAATTGALADDETMYYGYGAWEARQWAREKAENGDLPAVILTGDEAATRDDLYVESGFRTTGFTEFLNELDYRGFGVWAQDSYFGFWNQERVSRPDIDAHLLSRGDVTTTAFLAGGDSPTKPRTGTWKGLAIGSLIYVERIVPTIEYAHTPISEIRVGRAELKVNLDASEVDVTITGVTPQTSTIDADGELVTAAGVLRWEGVPLDPTGRFSEPRVYREIASLEDVFSSELLPEGERYIDKARSIRGQFYGEAGREVTGVFWKNDYVGSFGAYKD